MCVGTLLQTDCKTDPPSALYALLCPRSGGNPPASVTPTVDASIEPNGGGVRQDPPLPPLWPMQMEH